MSELPVADLLSVQEAIAILDAAPVQARVVELPLLDAIGLRLAREISADRDYPPFDKAVMDGYALRAGDVTSAETKLVVIDTIAAGHAGVVPLQPGQAVAIMTGAPVPAGADTVVPVEITSREGRFVRIGAPPRPGNAIARRGSDTTAGRMLLERGTRLGPAQIAVAASVGAAHVLVFARPVVAVLSTGDELIEIDQVPTGSQIRNSNSTMLVALLGQLGCEVRHVAHVCDDMGQVLSAIESTVNLDALFITGGMSMGEFDFVPRALMQLGAKIEIAKLRIKPGKPFVYARLNGDRCHVFGLPGNPVSAFVCTVRLAARVLARIAGGQVDGKVTIAQLTLTMPANGAREVYQPAILEGAKVTPLAPNGSADIFTLARANALLIRRENDKAAAEGDAVSVLGLD